MTKRVIDVVLVVQGEGRGHMTQALATRDYLVEAGHRVVGVYLGTSDAHPTPGYFRTAMGIPVATFAAPVLVADRSLRGASPLRTTAYNLKRLPTYVMAGLAMRRGIRKLRPDVVINFFDFIAGCVHLFSWRPAPPPRVAVAHSYMLSHPGAAAPPPGVGGRSGLRLLAAVAAAGCEPMGLSFDELPDAPGVRVAPPLLRPGLAKLTPTDGGYLLAYSVNAGYANEVATWQARRPSVEVHCYVPGGGRNLGLPPQPGFHVHDLDDERFLQHLAGCRALAGTAGFESVCEAFYLGKPVLAVPVDRHYEQAFNASDMERTGVARPGSFGDLDGFWASLQAPPAHRVENFRTWVDRAPAIMVDAVEQAACRSIR